MGPVSSRSAGTWSPPTWRGPRRGLAGNHKARALSYLQVATAPTATVLLSAESARPAGRALSQIESLNPNERNGDEAVALVRCAWRRAGRSGLPARCARVSALAQLPLSASGSWREQGWGRQGGCFAPNAAAGWSRVESALAPQNPGVRWGLGRLLLFGEEVLASREACEHCGSPSASSCSPRPPNLAACEASSLQLSSAAGLSLTDRAGLRAFKSGGASRGRRGEYLALGYCTRARGRGRVGGAPGLVSLVRRRP